MLSEKRSSKVIHCVGKLSIGPSPSQTLKLERRGGLQSQSPHASRGFQVILREGKECQDPGSQALTTTTAKHAPCYRNFFEPFKEESSLGGHWIGRVPMKPRHISERRFVAVKDSVCSPSGAHRDS